MKDIDTSDFYEASDIGDNAEIPSLVPHPVERQDLRAQPFDLGADLALCTQRTDHRLKSGPIDPPDNREDVLFCASHWKSGNHIKNGKWSSHLGNLQPKGTPGPGLYHRDHRLPLKKERNAGGFTLAKTRVDGWRPGHINMTVSLHPFQGHASATRRIGRRIQTPAREGCKNGSVPRRGVCVGG